MLSEFENIVQQVVEDVVFGKQLWCYLSMEATTQAIHLDNITGTNDLRLFRYKMNILTRPFNLDQHWIKDFYRKKEDIFTCRYHFINLAMTVLISMISWFMNMWILFLTNYHITNFNNYKNWLETFITCWIQAFKSAMQKVMQFWQMSGKVTFTLYLDVRKYNKIN